MPPTTLHPPRLRPGWELRDGVARPSDAWLSEERQLVLPARTRAAEGMPEDFPGFDIIVTTESPDSYGDVVLTGGIDWARFDANPVITPQHITDEPPIALCEKRWATETSARGGAAKVKAWAQRWRFNVPADGAEPDEIQETAAAYLAAYRNGFMRCASIHFRPKKNGMRFASDMTLEERTQYGLESEYGILWTSIEMLSVGCVSIPANPDCVMLSARACTQREFKALTDRVDALTREVTELRKQVPAHSPAAPDATIAPSAEGGRAAGAGDPQRSPAPASPAVPSGPSEDLLAKTLAAMRT